MRYSYRKRSFEAPQQAYKSQLMYHCSEIWDFLPKKTMGFDAPHYCVTISSGVEPVALSHASSLFFSTVVGGRGSTLSLDHMCAGLLLVVLPPGDRLKVVCGLPTWTLWCLCCNPTVCCCFMVFNDNVSSWAVANVHKFRLQEFPKLADILSHS